MKPCIEAKLGEVDRDGYRRVSCNRNRIRVHRLVWELFFGKIPAGKWVLHRCDNPPCIEPSHLYLGTNLENVRDRQERGRTKFGVQHGNCKITEAQAKRVFAMLDDGTPPIEVARHLKVSRHIINDMKRGRTWQHLRRA
jgi:hypothetical protein